jgi:hypothetical protein
MTASRVPVRWALWSKPPGSASDYHIVRASEAREDLYPDLEPLVVALLPGSPNRAASGLELDASLPWVTFGVEPAGRGRVETTGVCVTSKAAETDHAGRRLSQSLYFRFPLDAVAERRAGYTALWRTVRSLPVPQEPEPLTVEIAAQPWDEIAAGIERDGTFDWCAVAAAALLEGPVAVTATPFPDPDRAAVILDSVTGLLPYSFRSVTSAGTGVDGLTHHKLRLVFAPYAHRGAAEVLYTPDGHRAAETHLGAVGRSFLQELHALRDEAGGSVRTVFETLGGMTEPHVFGPGDTESMWAVSALRLRDPVGAILREITDRRGRLKQAPYGGLGAGIFSDRHTEAVEQILAAGSAARDKQTVLYEYLVRGLLPERLAPEAWPEVLGVVVGVVHEALAAPAVIAGAQAAEVEDGDREPLSAEPSAAGFGITVATRFADAVPAALRDELLSRLLDLTGAPAGPVAVDRVEALMAGLARLAGTWIGLDGPDRFPHTRAVLVKQPELVYHLLERQIDDPPGLRRALRFLDGGPLPDPWLAGLRTLLTAPPGRVRQGVRTEEIIDAEAAHPGLVEVLLGLAWTLDRTEAVLPVLWPALLQVAAQAGGRAERFRRRLADLRAEGRGSTLNETRHVRIDVLLLLAGEEGGERLTLTSRLTPAGISAAYLEGLRAVWDDPVVRPLRDRVATCTAAAVLALARRAQNAGADTPLAALAQLLTVFGPSVQPGVADLLIQARQTRDLDVDALPEAFWSGLGDQHRNLTDQHWISVLHKAGGSGALESVLALWPHLVAGGFTAPREALDALGRWPRISPARLALARLPGGIGLLKAWVADVERLTSAVRLPASYSPREAEQYREDLREQVRRGAWGNLAALALREYGSGTEQSAA